MFAILVVSSVVLATALVSVWMFRSKDDAIGQHQRALAALRDAERSHHPSSGETTPAPARTDHVHIVDAAPGGRVGVRRRPRASARRAATGRRRNAAEIAARPTIACLPTMWLSAPAANPALVELTPVTPEPEDRGPDQFVTAEPEAPGGVSSDRD